MVYAGTDPLTGKRHDLRETHPTYAAAEVALTRLQAQVDEDRHPKSGLTVSQAVSQWLEVAELEDTTSDRYEDLVRIYINPTFGELPAAKPDAELLERFYARLQRCRSLCNGRPAVGHTCRPLASSTVRKFHFVLRGSLERAVRWRQLGVNKAALVVTPPPAPSKPDPRGSISIWIAAWCGSNAATPNPGLVSRRRRPRRASNVASLSIPRLFRCSRRTANAASSDALHSAATWPLRHTCSRPRPMGQSHGRRGP